MCRPTTEMWQGGTFLLYCMLNEREVAYRQKCAADAGIPFTNYGIAIAYMTGILKRSIEIFPKLYTLI